MYNKEQLLARKNAELEQQLLKKNHEIEIESSLERVRKVAMSMSKLDDMLEICSTICQQLESLNVKEIRNVQTAIFYESKGTYMNYEYYAKHDKTFITETSYTNHEMHKAFATQMLKGKDEFFTTYMSKTELPNWIAYQKTTNVFIDDYLNIASSLNYYWYSLGPVALGISTYEPLKEEDINLFKRFLKVFELSYTRYLDIEQAIAQAREAQIQLALERVRARTMAMQKSSELQETSSVLFEQMKVLGEPAEQLSIGIMNEAENIVEISATLEGKKFQQTFRHSGDEPFVMNRIVKAWKAQQKSLIIEQSIDELEAYNKFRNKLTGSVKFPTKLQPGDRRILYVAFFSKGMLGLSTTEERPKESLELLERFAGVFDLTYTRFLDLKNAEAQAHESQIQLALERVRARTMAMQKSDELAGTVSIVFKQLIDLGIRPTQMRTCAIVTLKPDEPIGECWITNPNGEIIAQPFTVSYDGTSTYNTTIYTAWKQGEKFLVIHLSGEALVQHLNYLKKHAKIPTQQFQPLSHQPTETFTHVLFFSQGYLLIISSEPLTEYHEVFKRFGAVFQQTYTRFLDLQKAEAQARESHIQLALERVRARTMAMQKQNDLLGVLDLLVEQLVKLGVNLQVANFSNGLTSRDWDLWIEVVADANTIFNNYVHFPRIDHPYFHHVEKNIEAFMNDGTDLFKDVFSKEEKDSWQDYIHTQTIYKDLTTEEIKQSMYEKPGYTWSMVILKDTWVSICRFNTIPFSDEENALLRRFANAFGQTYTRFLDLKKAEAQAHESQIQLALERVRARTMAMQKSDELSDTAYILFQQFKDLGEDLIQITIGIFNEEERVIQLNVTGLDGSGSRIYQSFKMDIEEPSLLNKIYTAWKEEKKSSLLELAGKELHDWIAYRNSVARKYNMTDTTIGTDDRRFITAGFFSKGFISFSKSESIPLQTTEILERFATVFDQTYTRFLDLQKAEAQAKEAQIELGLERVRARAMAMQTSEELNPLIGTVFTELTKLDFLLTRCVILIYEGKEKGVRWWMANSETPSTPMNFFVKYADMPFFNEYFKGWYNRSLKWQYCLEGENKIKTDDFLFTETELSLLPDFVIAGMRAPDRVYLNASFNNFGNLTLASLGPLSEEHFNILLRFAKVFDLTYTRFNDLKQAEAQAKEAQIETALERVRSRSMGMQKSEELKEIIQVVYEQFVHLNILVEHAGFIMDYKERNDMHIWLADKHAVPFQVTIPYFDCAHWNSFNEAKEKGINFFANHLSFEEKNKFYQDLFKLFPVPDEAKEYYFSCSGLAVSTVLLENVGLYIENFSAVPYTDDENKTLMRFGKVFQQTYTRFLDLQKAEAQTRESQIELSLERVRAKTMAMHNSADVGETVAVMFDELVKLGIQTYRCGIGIMHDESKMEVWTAKPGAEGNVDLIIGWLNMNLHPLFQGAYNGWEKKKETFSYDLKDDDLINYFNAVNSYDAYPVNYDIASLPKEIFHNDFYFSEGTLFAFSLEKLSEEKKKIFKRFSAVFGQTYRRFLDLQKAEAQAREAKIETALEKVRSRSLAMHKSEEIQEVINEVFIRLKELEINLDSANIIIFENGSKDTICWTGSSASNSTSSLFHYAEDIDFLKDLIKAKENQLNLFVHQYSREQKNNFFNYVYETTALKETPNDRKQFILGAPCHTVSVAFSKNIAINLNSYSRESFTESENNIAKRFAKVFEQSYTRFLDLQKAEAQAREALIEAALERVRSRSLAVHKSDEFKEVIKVVFERLQELGFQAASVSINIFIKDSNDTDVFICGQIENGLMVSHFLLPYFDSPIQNDRLSAQKNNLDFFTKTYNSEEKNHFYDSAFELPDLKLIPGEIKKMVYDSERYTISWALAKNSMIIVNDFGGNVLSENEIDIVKRFARVFEQAYIRFLDLQKAEAQARESQIQLALERVRAKTMAMHSSEDVTSATETMFDELQKLGLDNLRGGITNIHPEKTMDVFGITNMIDGKAMKGFTLFDMNEHPIWQRLFESWNNKDEVFIDYLAGQEKEDYIRIVNSRQNYLPQSIIEFPDTHFQSYRFDQGTIWTYSLQPHSESDRDIMKRFASGFALTFRRYQDLKQAEAQAREAQIEAALERVRARTMAMFKSDELAETAVVVFQQLINLGIEPNRLYIGIINDESGDLEFWMTDEEGKQVSKRYVVNIHKNISIKKMYEGWKERLQTLSVDMSGNELHEWITYWNKEFGVPFMQGAGHQRRVQNLAYFSKGFIATTTFENAAKETVSLLNRFAAVFNSTYTRFNDLQLAEAQAREAQVEASLERVRAKAMAMQNSNDLSVAASMVFTELRKLGINPIRCGVGLLSKETRKAQLYTATSSPDGDSLSLIGSVMMSEHPVLKNIYGAWLNHEDIFPELSGEQLKSYYENLLAGLSLPTVPHFEKDEKQYGHFFSFSVGCLYAWSDKHYNENEIKILKRFASIIDLTFRRYLELQTSEANTKEAIKQAALDRIRADIASMRTINDLDRITPLIWNELTILGIPFIRCGVFIMDDSQQLIHTFLSTPDGKAIAAFHIPYTTPGNIKHVISHWHDNKNYIDHWDENAFTEFAGMLVTQGALISPEQYLKTIPHGGFYLHFLPFLQGMLYVGNLNQLNEEEISLIQSVADAFSTAYARYEYFNKLEAAKQQVDKTLIELKQTQQQLVQSEKMASLGELTAGIAHEIQNPLNFVNNFSEVSKELIDEMKVALESGDKEEAEHIANDIIQNLEKINHHGKRADAIVKGMLQHSRKSEGKKEPTDINALCDEYVRLSYHGMRAKDKSFNADYKTDFDETIGKINIVPQDIGRVLLNLFNNAFYAVSEKQRTTDENYKSLVSVQTKKVNDKIEIIVSDNGNGIPKNIIDKIFQPFFTTKPTGQGTGLGLSLAYDIITKEHNGTIKVDSKEGEGSVFIINLPVV